MDHQAFAQLLGNYGEFFGAVAVLATLLYLSVQVRQANSIARTQTVMQLHTEFNEINSARFTNPEVARICLLVQYPDQHETTDIDVSMIRGMAYHIHNIMWSAQSAYENNLLSLKDLTNYRNDLQGMIHQMPALVPEFIEILRSEPHRASAYVYEPLARRATGSRAGE